jgi:hypothetical protein
MRKDSDNLSVKDIPSDEILASIEEDVQEFTDMNSELDARRRLEEALESQRLRRELREFDFDFDDLTD